MTITEMVAKLIADHHSVIAKNIFAAAKGQGLHQWTNAAALSPPVGGEETTTTLTMPAFGSFDALTSAIGIPDAGELAVVVMKPEGDVARAYLAYELSAGGSGMRIMLSTDAERTDPHLFVYQKEEAMPVNKVHSWFDGRLRRPKPYRPVPLVNLMALLAQFGSEFAD